MGLPSSEVQLEACKFSSISWPIQLLIKGAVWESSEQVASQTPTHLDGETSSGCKQRSI